MKKIIGIILAAIVAAGFLGFTAPGHHLLKTLGFATACESSNC